ncbi:MAG: hypothetical protein ACRD2A_18985, partial [Vicinamibacterales bacterium]
FWAAAVGTFGRITMQDALMVYFNGEKNAGLFLAGVGVVAIVAATLMYRSQPDLRAFALTLGILALAEIALGTGLYLRTDPQVNRLVAQLGSEPSRFYSEEGARMTRVQRTFVVVEYVELAIIIVSSIVVVALKNRSGLTGVALGLLVNAACLLAFDHIAERRGAVYLAAIEKGALTPPRL